MKTPFKIALLLAGAAPLVALAQPPKAPAKAATSDGAFSIKNDRNGGITTYDTERGLGHMTKNVVVTQSGEDVVIRAQDATFDRNRNIANASIGLSVETRDSTITGDKLFADFNARTATITGHVVIHSHGKNDGVAAGLRGEAGKKPITVTCERVDWDYDIRQATATGNIHIAQGVNNGTCNKIVYDEKQNIINLLGNVRFTDDKCNTFIGQNILIYLQEGRITGSGIRWQGKGDCGPNTPAPAKTRAPKIRVPFAPAPTLPPDLIGSVAPPPPAPTAQPTATEEPAPTAMPEEPAEAAPVSPPVKAP